MLADFLDYLNSPQTLEILMANRFFLVLFVVTIVSIKRTSYESMFLAALLNLPGTILHEFAHFCVGFLLNAKPTAMSLLPKKIDGYYRVGNVGFRNMNFYNALPTSMAPLVMLPLGYYVNMHFFEWVPLTLLNYLLFLFILSLLIENAVPSRQDFKEGFGNVLGVAFYTFISLFLFAIY